MLPFGLGPRLAPTRATGVVLAGLLGLATFSTASLAATFAVALVGFLTSGLALLAVFFDAGTGLTFSGALGEGLLGALIAFVVALAVLEVFLISGFFTAGFVAAFLVANFVATADLADLAIGFLVGMARPQFKKWNKSDWRMQAKI